MKKIAYIVSLLIFVASCKNEVVKDYVTVSGKIIDQNSDSLVVKSGDFSKTIKVNADGTFSDTLKVLSGKYSLYDGAESTSIYLKNGYDLVISLDTKQFDESISYTGVGAEVNNYLASKALFQESVIENDSLFMFDKSAFDLKLSELQNNLKTKLNQLQNLDTVFVNDELNGFEKFTNFLANYYDDKQYLFTVLAKGKVSPIFENFENINGGTTSLADLKGKNVLIDVWATWCAPCRQEIPFLNEIEKAYHGKNIAFVSISVDKDKDKEAWKKMIAEKQMGGIQLYEGNDTEKSDFIKNYKVNSIPRFILIDAEGNIVDSDAPTPSSGELQKLLDGLKL